MSDEGYRYPQPHPYDNDGPGPSRPSKRPRDQMSMSRLNNGASSLAGPSLILPTRAGPYNSSSSNNNSNNSNMGSRPSLPPPARSSSSSQTLSTGQMVIDLTNSPPPQQDIFAPISRGRSHGGSGPSRSRVEVIDVDALPDSPALPPRWPPMDNPSEMRFARGSASRMLGGGPHFASRTVHHHHHLHRQQSHGIGSRPVPVEPNSIYSRIDPSRAVPDIAFQPRLFQDLEDPILGHGSRVGQALPDVNFGNIRDATIPPPFRSGGVQGGPQGAARRGVPSVMGTQEMMTLLNSFPRIWGQVPDGIGFDGFQPPVQLNYRQRAPGIIRDDSPAADPARARNIDYKSPPPAKEGFTRSPKENDILVCAHCMSELGSNEHGPVAQEVWASKCGHSYCGTCVATFRALPPSKSSTTRKTVRPKAKSCSVGCKINLAAKTSMFKIHL